MPLAVTSDPAQTLFFAQRGSKLPVRVRYMELTDHYVDASNGLDTAQRLSIPSLVVDARRFLELFAVSACTHEVLHELDIQSWEEIAQRAELVMARIGKSCGLNPSRVINDARDFLPENGEASERRFERPSMARVVAGVRSVLASFSIARLASLAATVELEAEGHRCRKAYWTLESFVQRNDPSLQKAVRTAGRLYAQGNLSVEEVAAIFQKHPANIAFMLEENGFCRSIDNIVMDDSSRAEKLKKIRDDRLSRRGEPVLEGDKVVRDVIASERIEGVDARQWMNIDRAG